MVHGHDLGQHWQAFLTTVLIVPADKHDVLTLAWPVFSLKDNPLESSAKALFTRSGEEGKQGHGGQASGRVDLHIRSFPFRRLDTDSTQVNQRKGMLSYCGIVHELFSSPGRKFMNWCGHKVSPWISLLPGEARELLGATGLAAHT